jgi:hypothetical protein
MSAAAATEEKSSSKRPRDEEDESVELPLAKVHCADPACARNLAAIQTLHTIMQDLTTEVGGALATPTYAGLVFGAVLKMVQKLEKLEADQSEPAPKEPSAEPSAEEEKKQDEPVPEASQA